MPRSKTPRRGAKTPALRLAPVRLLHGYISMFVAPSLIFFAATGALQTFRLPDDARAPMLLQKLARVHKDDVFAPKPVRPKRAAQSGAPAKAPPEKPKAKPSTDILKWFFALVSGAIAVTTCLGVWMGLTQGRRKAVLWLLLLAGAAAPVLILLA